MQYLTRVAMTARLIRENGLDILGEERREREKKRGPATEKQGGLAKLLKEGVNTQYHLDREHDISKS